MKQLFGDATVVRRALFLFAWIRAYAVLLFLLSFVLFFLYHFPKFALLGTTVLVVAVSYQMWAERQRLHLAETTDQLVRNLSATTTTAAAAK